MLIEQAAYGSRWRTVCPAAKAAFALAASLAAFIAHGPEQALSIAAALALLSVLGAGAPAWLYLRVALPASGFLALSCLSLLLSLSSDGDGGIHWHWASDAGPRIAELAARSLAALAAMLFLVLSTPLPDLIALLRRWRTPEVLLDLMVLCYRLLFVFSTLLQDTLTAQQARLGHGSPHRRLRSLSLLAASLATQIWLRARALHLAAQARNGDGPLRFLPRHYPSARRDLALALGAGSLLLIFAARA